MSKSLLMMVVLCAPGLVHAGALDQDPGTQVFKPVAELVDETIPPARCSTCQPHVERIKDLQRLRRFAHDRLKYFQQRGEETARRMANERDFVVGMGLVMEIGDLERAVSDYTSQIAVALKALSDCNATCGDSSPAGIGVTGTPTTTPPPATTTCPDCERISEDLQAAEARRARAAEALEHYRGEQQRQADQLRAKQNALRELRRNNQGNSAEAQKLEDDISFAESIEGRSMGAAFDAHYLQALATQVAEAEAEIERLTRKLEDCRKYCQPKKTSSLFRSPIPYALAGGAVAVGALAGGGGNQPAAIVNTPAPPLQTTNPTPPPTPDAIDLLMGIYLVQTCVCELDQGGQDAFLRVCQSVRQWRLTRTGATAARIDGDAPLITADLIIDANAQTVDGSAVGSSGTLRYSGSFGTGGSATVFLNYSSGTSTTRYRVTARKP